MKQGKHSEIEPSKRHKIYSEKKIKNEAHEPTLKINNYAIDDEKYRIQKYLKSKMRKNRAKNILIKFIIMVLWILIVYNVAYFINKTLARKENLEIFGINFFCVNTEAMENKLNKNDLVITKRIDMEKLQEGDIVAWNINNSVRINEIYKIYSEQDTGKIKYVTKFNRSFLTDIEELTEEKFIGKKVIRIPFLGLILKLVQSKVFFVIVFISLLLCYKYNAIVMKEKVKRKRKRKKDKPK